MAGTLQHYKIFIASPGGLQDERRTFKKIIEDINKKDAIERGFYFEPVGWEETLGQQGRPQGIINEELKKCDFLFLVLHDKWGTPTSDDSKYSSGTEEEFHVALECLNEDIFPMLRIALFFKEVSKNQLADPGPQLSRVLAFKKEREDKKDFLYETFDVPENFSKKIEYHLAKILRELESTPKKSKITTNIETTFEDTDFEWLNNISKYNNWDMAFEKAEDLLRKGKTIEAELIFSQITQRSNNPYLIAKYGKYLRNQGRIQSSINELDKALKLAEVMHDTSSKAYCYRQLGRIEEYKGKMKKALANFQIAFELYNEIDDDKSIARTLRDLAFVENKLGNTFKAIEQIKESIDIYTKENNLNEKAASLGYLGVIYKDLGDFDLAIESHKEALLIQEKNKNYDALAKINSNLAVIHRLKKDYSKAKELHSKSLNFYESINDKRGIAREYGNLGVIYRREGEFLKAIENHYAALELEEKVGNDRGMQIQYSNIGLNHLELGNFGKAKYYFNKSLEISRHLDDLKGESHQYKNFSSLYLKTKQLDKSMLNAIKGLELDQMTNNKFGIAGCNRLISLINIENGEFEEARKNLNVSLKIYNEMGLSEYMEEINNEIKTLPNRIARPASNH